MRRLSWLILGTSVLLGLATGPGAGVALACISESPTFAEAVARADVIARVTIVDGTDDRPDDVEAFRVDRLLKGDPGSRISLADPVNGLCRDRIGASTGGPDGGVGMTIILATDVEYFGEVIHPYWIETAQEGRAGTAGWPPAAADLAELEAAILIAVGALDTSTLPPDQHGGTPYGAIPPVMAIAGALAISAVMVRRRFPPAG
jgi:hypothetical protein